MKELIVNWGGQIVAALVGAFVGAGAAFRLQMARERKLKADADYAASRVGYSGGKGRRQMVVWARLLAGPALLVGLGLVTICKGAGTSPGGDIQPQVIHQVKPAYPSDPDAGLVGGTVLTEFVVDPEGNVTRVHPGLSPNVLFTKAAVGAVSQWKFRPGLMGGAPVAFKMEVPISFLWPEVPREKKQAPMVRHPYWPHLASSPPDCATVRCIVTTDGNVAAPKLVSTSRPDFGAEVLSVIKNWSFVPAVEDHRYTESTVTISFSVRSGAPPVENAPPAMGEFEALFDRFFQVPITHFGGPDECRQINEKYRGMSYSDIYADFDKKLAGCEQFMTGSLQDFNGLPVLVLRSHIHFEWDSFVYSDSEHLLFEFDSAKMLAKVERGVATRKLIGKAEDVGPYKFKIDGYSLGTKP